MYSTGRQLYNCISGTVLGSIATNALGHSDVDNSWRTSVDVRLTMHREPIVTQRLSRLHPVAGMFAGQILIQWEPARSIARA